MLRLDGRSDILEQEDWAGRLDPRVTFPVLGKESNNVYSEVSSIEFSGTYSGYRIST